MGGVRRGILYSSLGRYALMLIGLVSSMILARILSPAEIGTFAIASSLVMIMAEFRILGANAYLVREKNIDEGKIRSSYGVTVLVSWSLGLLIILSANYIASFFDIEELSTIFLLLSIGFFLAPYVSIPDAILSREFKFREISIIRITAAIIQLIVTVLLVFQGYSFYSLAIGQVASIAVQSALSLYFTRHTPVYIPIFKGMKPIMKLGVFSSLGHMFRNSQYTLPDIVIGKLGSVMQVGLFSRGLGFTAFIYKILLSGVTPVALPYFSDVKNKGHNMSDAYVHASKLITGVVWPALAVASIASLPAIRLMFGDQWDDAAPIATVVSIWAIFKAAHVLAPNAMVASGFEGVMLVKEVVVFLFFLILIVVGYKASGLLGVAYGFVLSGVIDFLISSVLMYKLFNVNFFSYFSALAPSLAVMLSCAFAAYLVSLLWPFVSTPSYASFFQLLIIVPPIWLFSLFAFKHSLCDEVRKMCRKII